MKLLFKISFLVFFAFSLLLFSQKTLSTKIIFDYDEAGNQIYRGQRKIVVNPEVPVNDNLSAASVLMTEEERFWLGINIYPVPVKSVLTISWNEENNALIDNVTLYQHNTLTNLFQQQNLPNLNSQVQVNMSDYYPGVYVISFQLKNGKVISKNILKE